MLSTAVTYGRLSSRPFTARYICQIGRNSVEWRSLDLFILILLLLVLLLRQRLSVGLVQGEAQAVVV